MLKFSPKIRLGMLIKKKHVTTELSTLCQQFLAVHPKARAGTTLSVMFLDYDYFLRYYDLFDFMLERSTK